MQSLLFICKLTSLGFGLLALSVVTSASSPESRLDKEKILRVQYPQMQDKYERDFDNYFLELLTLALDKSKTSYTLEPIELPVMVESRSHLVLQKNKNMLYWLNSNSERESHLTAIKIPLFKGLIGWRLLLIHEQNQALFSKITSANDLSKFVAGLGHDWPDTEIFEFNHLKVTTSSSWDGLFEMLKLGRIDYFPRSVIEIERELRLFARLNLYVESSLAIHYPAAYYFFVNKDNPDLARAIESGLLAMIKDGDFDNIFNKYFGKILKSARLKDRKIIHLKNKHHFPIEPMDLWYKP